MSLSDRTTHRVLAGLFLFEGGGEGDRRNHGHGAPLLGLLPDVDGLGGERLEGRFEAGVQRLVVRVRMIVLHRGEC